MEPCQQVSTSRGRSFPWNDCKVEEVGEVGDVGKGFHALPLGCHVVADIVEEVPDALVELGKGFQALPTGCELSEQTSRRMLSMHRKKLGGQMKSDQYVFAQRPVCHPRPGKPAASPTRDVRPREKLWLAGICFRKCTLCVLCALTKPHRCNHVAIERMRAMSTSLISACPVSHGGAAPLPDYCQANSRPAAGPANSRTSPHSPTDIGPPLARRHVVAGHQTLDDRRPAVRHDEHQQLEGQRDQHRWQHHHAHAHQD